MTSGRQLWLLSKQTMSSTEQAPPGEHVASCWPGSHGASCCPQAYLADAVLTLKAVPMSAQEKRHLRAFRCNGLPLLMQATACARQGLLCVTASMDCRVLAGGWWSVSDDARPS